MLEHRFQCPCCWEEITMVLDLSEGSTSYVEDCEVCCRPLQISFQADGEPATLSGFSVQPS